MEFEFGSFFYFLFCDYARRRYLQRNRQNGLQINATKHKKPRKSTVTRNGIYV